MKNKFEIILVSFLFSCATFLIGCENAISSSNEKSKIIRKPAVSGAFYPDSKRVLEKTIDAYLQNADPKSIKRPIRAIIVPHAGYVYSGQVAAYAYKSLIGQDFDTAIIMCNSHTSFFDGISAILAITKMFPGFLWSGLCIQCGDSEGCKYATITICYFPLKVLPSRWETGEGIGRRQDRRRFSGSRTNSASR